MLLQQRGQPRRNRARNVYAAFFAVAVFNKSRAL
jgi:hypothetical protein